MEGQEMQQRDQSGVLDRLPFNLTQLLAFAMKKPRDPIAAIDSAIAQLRAMPQFAKKAYYSIPFSNKDGSKTIVEGPSIKAATALSGCWGNNVEGAFIGEETDDYIDVSGYFFDFETGKLTIRPLRVSKTYKTEKGEVKPWRKDMLDKQIAAGVSKAVRNADLNGLPAGMIAEYFAEAKRIVAKGGKVDTEPVTPEDIKGAMEGIFQAFERLTVERREVADYIARMPELDSEEAVVAHLQGVLNSIEDGQTTVDQVFTVGEAPITQPQATTVAKGAPEADRLAQRAAKPTLPPLPAKLRIMASNRQSICETCKKKILVGQNIGYDASIGRAHHREHFA